MTHRQIQDIIKDIIDTAIEIMLLVVLVSMFIAVITIGLSALKMNKADAVEMSASVQENEINNCVRVLKDAGYLK